MFFLLAVAVAVFGAVFFFRSSSLGTALLWNVSAGGTWLLPLITVSALIDSINPCAFSILFLTIAFLFSLGKFRAQIFQVGGSYILGLFAAYFLIGLGLLQALHFFSVPNFMAKVGATLLIALGLTNMGNELFPAFPVKLRIPQGAHSLMARLIEKASFPTAFLLGGLVGVCEFPCTGGPYLMVLGLLHDQATYFKGLGYLILYNLIFVFPLLVILAIASNRLLGEKVQAWQQKERRLMRFGSGVAMVALGLLIFFY